MKTKPIFLILVAFVGSILLLTTGYALAMNVSRAPSSTQAIAGSGITYQGYLEDGGTPANGSYDFYFELFDAAFEGTSILTTTNGDVDVVDGLFTVLLDFDSSAFNGDARWLEIGVRLGGETYSYTPLDGRQPITAAPYAMYAVEADTVDGFHASELGNHYQNVVVVAKSGGDYTSVQAAIDSVTDAVADNPYLVWVAPGVYSETVAMKPYVHLQGAGQEATIISSTVSNTELPPTQASLILARDTSVRGLTVKNSGVGDCNVSILSTDSTTDTLVTDVTAWAHGNGSWNFAILISGSVTLQYVNALGENGSSWNVGLRNNNGIVKLIGGTYTAIGGEYSTGINNYDDSKLVAESVTALAENASDENFGLENSHYATAILRGGTYTGKGGSISVGIHNVYTSTLGTEYVYALGENGTDQNNGLLNRGGAKARLLGGSFTGRGGDTSRGIRNSGGGTSIMAENIIALGENGSSGNYGLFSVDSGVVTLQGGTFTGRGGSYAFGINNWDATLAADGVTALGENSSGTNGGSAYNLTYSVTLRNSSLIGRGGSLAYGIQFLGMNFKGEFITALGEDASNSNYGFYQTDSASTDIQQSILSGTTNAIKSEYGYFTVSNSRLVGGPVSTDTGAVTCVLVTRGTTISTDGSTCP